MIVWAGVLDLRHPINGCGTVRWRPEQWPLGQVSPSWEWSQDRKPMLAFTLSTHPVYVYLSVFLVYMSYLRSLSDILHVYTHTMNNDVTVCVL